MITLEQEIAELRKWKEAVIDACTCIFYDVSGLEPDPRVVVETLIQRNVEMALDLKPEKRPNHELISYKQEDRRTLRELTTTAPMTAQQHQNTENRRVKSRRTVEDRRMEKDLYPKFGE